MTAAVAFLCKDGVVIGADSMITTSIGGMPLAQHVGKKVHTLPGDQIFAYAGDQGLGDRFRILVGGSGGQMATLKRSHSQHKSTDGLIRAQLNNRRCPSH